MNALARLRRGEAVFGLFLTYPITAVAEIALWCGYDFIIVDAEHGASAESDQLDVLRIIANTDAFSLVRVRPSDRGAIERYLDFGADGIIVPDVESVGHAQLIASSAHGRWTGGLRVDQYGAVPTTSRSRALVIVLVERPQAVEHIDAIMSV